MIIFVIIKHLACHFKKEHTVSPLGMDSIKLNAGDYDSFYYYYNLFIVAAQ